jgi:hypothetical protein
LPVDRLARLLAQVRSGSDEIPGTRRICEVAAEVTDTSGAGIMLLSGDLPLGSLGSTNPVSELIEELQYTLGEGPCVDAHHLGVAVLEPGLATPVLARWQAFTPLVVAAGVEAVFGFPVRVGAVRLGALDLYRNRPGPLSDDQYADALVMADVAARAILVMQADASPGSIANEVEAEANFHFVVHQASGMVSVQLDVSVAEALIRLRAYAFRTSRPVAHVAREVVDRRLRFDGLEE